ncbi:unnamed protein product [Arabidopsis arenosa]|uniref:Uncharacterized protein n=1 Tax=Arabidopsis arenosa TaxID=38785 RepID=A0A8S2A648_ARAAE|nr:unnamed protein product [Arabidopsis arenosa]
MRTRSQKPIDLVALSIDELGRLERSKKKSTKQAEMNMNVLPEGVNQEGNNNQPPRALPTAEGGNNLPIVPPAAIGPIDPAATAPPVRRTLIVLSNYNP